VRAIRAHRWNQRRAIAALIVGIRQNLSARDLRGSICGCGLLDSERLPLLGPQQGKIDPSGEVDDGQFERLVAFDYRLDDSGRQSAKPNQAPHRSAINSSRRDFRDTVTVLDAADDHFIARGIS
jgi:hypothetical protein